MNDREASQKLVSAIALAAFLGCSPATVYSRAKQGQIPHYKIGDRLLFDRTEVLKALRVPAETTQVEIPKLTAPGRR